MNYQKDIAKLENDISKHFDNIFEYCKQCNFIDCRGYLWLLPCESKKFYDFGLPVVEVNGDINFLDTSARNPDGTVNVNFIGPKCNFRDKKGGCTIHEISPFICKLYPLDIKIIKGKQFLVLHHDCAFIRKVIESDELLSLSNKIFKTFSSLDKNTLKYILERHKKVSEITTDPKSYKQDDYQVIIKFEKGDNKMSKCVAVLDSKRIKELKLKLKKKNSKKVVKKK